MFGGIDPSSGTACLMEIAKAFGLSYKQGEFSDKTKQACSALKHFSDFILPRYDTVKYGRHSSDTWAHCYGPSSKLASSERNAPTLKDFKRMINCRDISTLDNSSCVSCYLCNT